MFSRTLRTNLLGTALGALALAAAPMDEADAQLTDPVEIMKQAHLNLYYAADDGKATVTMTLTDKRGKTRSREFVMFRLDIEEGGPQKYYTYFLEPGDVRRTAFMVWKEPDKDDSRWIYVPAIDLVRRISANDKGSSFVGSDFSYEDVSGRHWTDDTHTLVRTEDLNGRPSYVIESIPTSDKDSFTRKVSWIDVENLLPMKEEYYDKKDRLERVFEALETETIDGVLTITKRRMSNLLKEHQTEVVFGDVGYDVGVEEDLFSERYLKAPPSKLIAQ